MLTETRRRRRRAARRAGRELAGARRHRARSARCSRRPRRPLVILGGSRWTDEARQSIARFAERFDLPVATSFRRALAVRRRSSELCRRCRHRPQPGARGAGQGRRSRCSSSAAACRRCRPRPTRCSTSRRRSRSWSMCIRARRSSAASISRRSPIQATPAAFAAALETLQPAGRRRLAAARPPRRMPTISPGPRRPRELPGAFQYGEVDDLAARPPAAGRDHLQRRRQLSPSGSIAIYRFRSFGTQLAPTSGSMGYGVPAAVLAKRQHPDRIVVAFAGDGCFLMNGQEFATAVQYDVAVIVVIVVDNGMYGTIRMHQERDYPGRVVGTAAQEPGFCGCTRRPSAAMASGSSAPRSSRRPSSARSPPASRRSSIASSIRARSRSARILRPR